MNEHFARSGQRVEERIGSEKVVSIGGIYDSVGRTCGFRNLGKVGKCSEERLNSLECQLRCLVCLPHQAHDGVPGVNERSGNRSPYVAAHPSHEDTHGILGPFFMRRSERCSANWTQLGKANERYHGSKSRSVMYLWKNAGT